MKNYMGYVSVDKLLNYANNQKDHMIDANDIARFPTADVAPVVHAHWTSNGIEGSMLSACSACGYSCGAYSLEYCPKCGARMDEQEEAQ